MSIGHNSTGTSAQLQAFVVALRKRDREEVFEEEALIETYLAALGMLADTPLGQAAMKRDGVAG